MNFSDFMHVPKSANEFKKLTRNVSFVCDDIFYLQFMQLAIVLYKVRRNNQ